MKDIIGIAQDYKRDIYLGWQEDIAEISTVAEIMRGYSVHSILEIGTAEGGSAYIWNKVLDLDRFISVDIDEDKTRPMRDIVLSDMKNVTCIPGYSQEYNVVKLAKLHVGFGVDAVFIDGGHTYAEVKADWENYGPLATKLVVFHDICLPDVKRLWDEIYRPKISIIETGRYGMGVIFV